MSTIHDLSENTPFIGVRVSRKDNTVSMLYNPAMDSRVPVDVLHSADKLMPFLDKNNLHGYDGLTMEQAEKVLLESKQYYRAK